MGGPRKTPATTTIVPSGISHFKIPPRRRTESTRVRSASRHRALERYRGDRRNRAATEDAKRASSDADQAKIDIAVTALKAALPLPKNPDAINILVTHGLGRDGARRLIEDRAGRDWILAGAGTKTAPYTVQSSAGIQASRTCSEPMTIDEPIPADAGAQGPQETMFKNVSAPRTCESSNSCGSDYGKAGAGDTERFW